MPSGSSSSASASSDFDLEYVRGWTHRLDESIGSDEVSERLERALGER